MVRDDVNSCAATWQTHKYIYIYIYIHTHTKKKLDEKNDY